MHIIAETLELAGPFIFKKKKKRKQLKRCMGWLGPFCGDRDKKCFGWIWVRCQTCLILLG